MSHGVMEQWLQVFKSVLGSRHTFPPSCVCCALKQTHTHQKSVMWKVCLLKCACLIMVFPSISVSPPPSLPPSALTFREDPTSLGQDVLPLKLHGEFVFAPSLAQQHASVLRRSPPPLSAVTFLTFNEKWKKKSFILFWFFSLIIIVCTSFLWSASEMQDDHLKSWQREFPLAWTVPCARVCLYFDLQFKVTSWHVLCPFHT